jgi:hypothetical protein
MLYHPSSQYKKQGVCHIVALLAIYIEKYHLKAIKELWKTSNISPCKNIIFKKILFKQTKFLQDNQSSTTNIKFQHKPKYHLSKMVI